MTELISKLIVPKEARLPDFIGIGAPKAGTTWLARCLGQHPDVFMPAAKELVFFDYGDYEQRLPDYLAHFRGLQQERAVGEFTTRYLASQRPAPRIQQLIPQARLLVCLRNPADQIYSHYWHLARQNFHQPQPQPQLSFEAAVEKFPEYLLTPARYWDQLQYWLQYFPRQQFHIILYDDIKASPEEVLQQTYRFLGVDDQFRPASATNRGSAERQGTSPRNAAAARIHRRVYATLNRRIYQPLKSVIGVHRANRLKDQLRVRPLMEKLFFRKGYPQLAAATRKQLNAEFADQVTGLEHFLQRDLSDWK